MKKPVSKEQIESIMSKFDFESVHAIMKLTKWTWHGDDTPTVAELREHALYLFGRMNNDPKIDSTSSGGLEVYREGDVCAGLRFIFCESWKCRV